MRTSSAVRKGPREPWTRQGTNGFLGPRYSQGRRGDLLHIGYPSTALIQMGDWCGSAVLMPSPYTKTWARHTHIHGGSRGNKPWESSCEKEDRGCFAS